MNPISTLFSRSKDPFEALLSPHIDHIYRLSYRFTGNREGAEDLTQELLTKLYNRRDELTKIEPLRPWISRVLYNLFIDSTRSAGRQPTHNPADYDMTQLEAANSPEQEVASTQIHSQVLASLKKLNPDQRALVTMHDMEGFTLPELVELLDTPIGTLKSRLHRARAKIRKELQSESMEPFAP
ncbi:MAG: sigma-70 family RNA polymerase sigma factor [Gammaproteobacteria bacterium]|nr:sigma-70 family RNA polymerase sigma factor [Gammaproteobacteria bacterium]